MVVKSKIEKIIEKGSDVAPKKETDDTKKNSNFKIVNVRMPEEFYETVQGLRKKRLGLSLTGWILEAMQQKVEREKSIENADYWMD